MSLVVSPRAPHAAELPAVDGTPPPRRSMRAVWLALLVLVVGVLVTLAAGAWQQRTEQRHHQEVVEHEFSRMTAILAARLEDHVARVRSVAAFIGASEHVSEDEWQRYSAVAGLADIQSQGAAGLVYAPRVHADGGGMSFPVRMIAPVTARMQQMLGFDLLGEGVRRAAIEAATARNEVVLSAPVTLQDGGSAVAAGLFVLPVKQANRSGAPPTLQRDTVRGVVVLAIRYERWIASVVEPWLDAYAIELVDETGGGARTLLAAPAAARYGGERVLRIAGRMFRLRFFSVTPAAPSLALLTTHVAGSLLSVSLAVMTWMLAAGRAHAQAVAQRAVAGLGESERRFALAISATSDGVWEWAPGQRGLFLSSRAKAILRDLVPRTDGNWRAVLSGLPAKERRALFVALRSHLKHRHPLDVAVTLPGPAGATRHLRIRGQAQWDAFGRTERIAGAVSDVSRQRQRDAEFDRARRFHARILDLLPHPVLVKSADHRYVLVNRAGTEFFGTSAEGILNRRTAEVLPGQGELHDALDDQVIREGGVASGEFHITLANGGDRTVIVRKAAVPGPEGEDVVLGVITDVTELRRTEAALRASLAELDSLFRHSPLGMAMIRMDGSIVRANRAFARMVGVSVSDLPGMRYAQITPERCRALDRAKTIEALRQGAVTPYERAFVRPDGREVPVVLSGAVMRDADGGTRLWTVAEDISERKAAEAALKHAHALNKSMLDALPDTLVQVDADLRVVAFKPGDNEAMRAVPADLIGTPLERLVSPSRLAAIEPVLRQVMRERRAQHVEYRARDGAGVMQDYDAVASPVATDGVLVVLRNVTTRRRHETALRESEARFRLLADAAPVIVWMSDAQMNVTYANRAWMELTQSSADASQGVAWMTFIHPDDRTRAERAGREASRTRERYTIELRVRRFDGTWRWLHAVGVPRIGEDGEFAGFIGCGSDITDEKQALHEVRSHRDHLAELVAAQTADLLSAKERAERASAAKTLFVANMSHELRSPMHAILSYARLGEARGAQLAAERVHDYFARIRSSGERLLTLLDRLLDLSRLEAGRITLDLKPVDLHGVVRDVVHEFAPLAAAGKLHVEMQAETAVPHVVADAARISQVVRNLLSNAIRYSPQGGSIRLRLAGASLPVGRRASDSAQRAGVALTVSDTGVGIPADELECIFDKFVESTKTRTGAGGTGLGLAICKQIIEAHNGIIRAEAPHEGGARLTAIIPAAHTLSNPPSRIRSHA